MFLRDKFFHDTHVNFVFRSDVLGQVMPLVGMDWSHIGVTQLFSAIKVCTLISIYTSSLPSLCPVV